MSRDVPSAAEGPFTLMPLPFSEGALDPIISAHTVQLHYGKHHKGYVDKLNTLVRQHKLEDLSLVEVIKRTHGNREYAQVLNNAAQVWNHDFYWQSLTPAAGSAPYGQPPGELARLIDESFGNLQKLKALLVEQAVAQFGSGWVWLVHEAGRLKVEKTGNAENPIVSDGTALLTVDVWEHAYYLDYQNRREEHVKAVVDKLLNWKFAAENLVYAATLTSAH